ncbi:MULTISPECIES: ferritin-like domain-containing protein [Nocardiopsidaceae]|uniref:Ferritin-like domain-containing protein n=1 Tax=Streptomonospora nanhaiensis TaxID=1323731 RepID=A0ABY6YQV6_9ACTN|nr:ferritin-like domain-containing protein [Streptomonospora nanhaiensis]WAE74668.1 ferritin-like domain-containing protein [Streptomonospora nanhaiensis]
MGQVNGCVSRRTVLGAAVAGAAVAGLAGCGEAEWYPADVTPDEYVLRSVIREKERTVSLYEAAISGGTGPADLLERLLEHHLTHVDALVESLPEGASPTPPADPAGGGESPPEGGPAPGGVLDTAGLRLLESAATSARLDQAAAVSDPGLAQLISGIGACEAGHAYLLARA